MLRSANIRYMVKKSRLWLDKERIQRLNQVLESELFELEREVPIHFAHEDRGVTESLQIFRLREERLPAGSNDWVMSIQLPIIGWELEYGGYPGENLSAVARKGLSRPGPISAAGKSKAI